LISSIYINKDMKDLFIFTKVMGIGYMIIIWEITFKFNHYTVFLKAIKKISLFFSMMGSALIGFYFYL
jgi:hypothetical protein